MCHINVRNKTEVKRPLFSGRFNDVDTNLTNVDTAYAGKYKELTTFGNAELL